MITKFNQYIKENLDLYPQKYEIRFKRDGVVFVVFSDTECGKMEIVDNPDTEVGMGINANYRRQDTSVVKDGVRDVDMEIMVDKGQTLMVDIDLVHHEEDNIDLAGFSLTQLVRDTDWRGGLDVTEFDYIKSSTARIILDPTIKNGVIMSLSIDDLEVKGVHY